MSSDDPRATTDSLVLPIDRYILNVLSNGRRQTPRNLAAIINTDDTRNYIGNRLRALEKRGYLYSPGPADRSGMYEITSWGRVAEYRISQYDRGYNELFHELVIRTVETQPDPEHVPDGHYPENQIPAPDPNGTTYIDWIKLTESELNALYSLIDITGITIPSDFTSHIEADKELNTNDAADVLYALHFYGLADRHDGMDAYTATEAALTYLTSGASDDISEALKNGIRQSELADQVAIHDEEHQYSDS